MYKRRKKHTPNSTCRFISSPERPKLCFNSFIVPHSRRALTNQHTRRFACSRYHRCYRRLPLLFAHTTRKHSSFDAENSKLFHPFTCSLCPQRVLLLPTHALRRRCNQIDNKNIYTFNLCTWFWFKLRALDAHPVHIDAVTRTFYFQDMTQGGKSKQIRMQRYAAHIHSSCRVKMNVSSDVDCFECGVRSCVCTMHRNCITHMIGWRMTITPLVTKCNQKRCAYA